MHGNGGSASKQTTCSERSTGNGHGIALTTRTGTAMLAGHL
jgi:hypothetical protein